MKIRKKRLLKNKSGKIRLVRKLSFLVFIILTVVFTATTLFSGSVWMKGSKFVIARVADGGGIDVLIFDPSNSEIVKLGIPENTELEVAGNLGVRRAGKLWDLSVDENKEGLLVKQTLEKNLLLPIDGWVGYDNPFTGANYLTKVRFVFVGRGTNLGFRDRLKVVVFLIRNPKSETRLNIYDTPFLKEEAGDDGKAVYRINGEVPEKVRSYFSEKHFFENNYKIMIKRDLGNSYLSEKVGKIIESLGAKPAYSLYDGSRPGTCEIYTDNSYLLTRLTNIFNCRSINKNEGVFDAVIYIGSGFEKEF